MNGRIVFLRLRIAHQTNTALVVGLRVRRTFAPEWREPITYGHITSMGAAD